MKHIHQLQHGVAGVIALTLMTACQPDVSSVEPMPQKAQASHEDRQINVADSVAEHSGSNALKAEITVYKSPTCGCCQEWVNYLEEEGFQVTAIDHDNVDAIKTKFGLPNDSLKSCHTAIVDGYLVEGHVPANDIERLLSDKPAHIKGLSAPGMPMMSPGMASRTPRDYAVLSFTESGETAVYSQY